jgi:hypothetical protein
VDESAQAALDEENKFESRWEMTFNMEVVRSSGLMPSSYLGQLVSPARGQTARDAQLTLVAHISRLAACQSTMAWPGEQLALARFPAPPRIVAASQPSHLGDGIEGSGSRLHGLALAQNALLHAPGSSRFQSSSELADTSLPESAEGAPSPSLAAKSGIGCLNKCAGEGRVDQPGQGRSRD